MTSTNIFSSVPGFCPECGSILPIFEDVGNVKCFTCKRQYGPEVFTNELTAEYTINFNKIKFNVPDKSNTKKPEAEGPIVERRCGKCGNDKMSYATLQLRSADEGQTVFYTCVKCKHKEIENS